MAGVIKKGEVKLSCSPKHKNLSIKLESGERVNFSEAQAFVSKQVAEEMLADGRAYEFQIKEIPQVKKQKPAEQAKDVPAADDSESANDEAPTIAPKKHGKKNQ